jgi:hypothetical protein
MGAIAGVRPCWENEVISSIQVGLVTGQAVGAALVHQKLTAHESRSPAASCLFAAKCRSCLQILWVEAALQQMLGEPCGDCLQAREWRHGNPGFEGGCLPGMASQHDRVTGTDAYRESP